MPSQEMDTNPPPQPTNDKTREKKSEENKYIQILKVLAIQFFTFEYGYMVKGPKKKVASMKVKDRMARSFQFRRIFKLSHMQPSYQWSISALLRWMVHQDSGHHTI